MAGKKVTIKDVAHRAGFSISTVSHVLNETRFVENSTREKIQKAIEELNYRPNILARSLRGKGSKTIGVVISDLRQGFFAEVVKAIDSRANQREFNVMLCDSEDDAKKGELDVDILLRKGIDGLVFAPVDTGQLFEQLWLSELPCVQIDRKLQSAEADFVGIDNVGSAEQATRRLFDNGYECVGFIGYGSEVYTMAMRFEGYRRAVASRGKEDLSLRIVNYNKADLEQPIQKWLQQHPAVDAVLCGNDDICYATMTAVQKLEKSIPEDFGIISYDDIRWFSMLKCPVTAIRQPTDRIGTVAVDLLIDRIEGTLDEAPKDILLDAELIIRKSCLKGGDTGTTN